MPVLKCAECGANADKTADGKWAHCASCNTIFEPPQEDDKQGEAKQHGKKENLGEQSG
ncbi:hypothetical protein H2203_004926 [Taxawa tesnikishii (nom. ined.)]|nr:hypothetical protein H2203_004926 [Dothideales sp. JES 119]